MHKSRSSITDQLSLIKKAERTGKAFDEVLERAGWTYDDLIYKRSRIRAWAGPPPLRLGELRSISHHTPVVSFFTGCGGMDLGLEAAGYRHVAAFEINEVFCKTLRRNRQQWKVFGPPTHPGDVSRFDEISEVLGGMIRTPFEGLFVGCPPCQPFSIAANQRFAKCGSNFKRIGFAHKDSGSLFLDFVRLIIAFRPNAFLIENVPGLRDVDGGKQLRSAIRWLRSNDYRVDDPFVLDAAEYGVPQHRLRLFLFGSLVDRGFKLPDRSRLLIGAGGVLSGLSPRLRNSETRKHHAQSVFRYMRLDYGQRDALGRVDRLDPTLPSKTVIAGGTDGGGRSHLHPEIPRTLSVRECARLQTFPDDFIFVGSSARQFTQVGNAVPPVLAAQLGRSLLNSYF